MFRPSLQRLDELPDEAVAAMNDALDAVPNYSVTDALAEAVTAASKQVGQDVDGDALIQVLIALRGQVERPTKAADEDDIAALSADLAESPDLNIEGEDERRAFARRIASLIRHDAIATTAAAVDVLGEDERIFEGARTLTDIRPVFGVHPDQRPTAAIIVNTLKIDCFTARGPEEFYVSLDPDDLENLKEVLERAITKTETIRSLLRDIEISEVPSIEPPTH